MSRKTIGKIDVFSCKRTKSCGHAAALFGSVQGYNFPKKMIEQLAGMGYTCDKAEEGVYLLSHTHLIPVQVVLIDKIDAEKYPWISVIRRLTANNQKEGVFKMNETRNLFKEEFEEKDRMIQDLSEELKESREELKESREELKSKDSMIEKLKSEIVKLGGNVAMF